MIVSIDIYSSKPELPKLKDERITGVRNKKFKFVNSQIRKYTKYL